MPGGWQPPALRTSLEQPPELLRGLSDELTRRGLSAEGIIVQRVAAGVESAAAAAEAVIRQEPSCRAFFCDSDEAAAGAFSALRGEGLVPGKECAVIGLGNTRLARSLCLTSIDPGVGRLADRIVAVVREGIVQGAFGARRITVSPELCARDT
jgi:DNA-binding LacI/PurR family transcriptional regulator